MTDRQLEIIIRHVKIRELDGWYYVILNDGAVTYSSSIKAYARTFFLSAFRRLHAEQIAASPTVPFENQMNAAANYFDEFFKEKNL